MLRVLERASYLDGIVLLNVRVGESEGSAVVGDNVGDLVGAGGLASDAAELELGLVGVNLVGLVSSLHVVEDSEVLAGSLDRHNVHDTERELGVSSDLAVDLDESFLVFNDLYCLLTRNCISQSISKEHGEGHAFLSLVGSGAGSGGVNSSELVQHPVGGSCDSLLMLLGSSCLEYGQTTSQDCLPFSLRRYILIINSSNPPQFHI